MSLTPDGRREIACPRKCGDTIAAGRCLSEQEQGCYCPKAHAAIGAMLDVATAKSIWVKREPAWKLELEARALAQERRLAIRHSGERE